MSNHVQRLHRCAAICAALAFLAAPPLHAATRRFAVVVGNDTGGPSEKPLRYAEEDAAKVADVLSELGDVHAGDLFLLKAAGRDAVRDGLARAGALIDEARQNPADRTLLIFFYSGHSDGEALELGAERLGFSELRGWISATKADVRLLVVDGCKSGAITQSKGGVRAEPFEIKLTDQLDATGEVLLTSSAADELALESREIRGSFFTHHLVSGLRGAADTSGDGRVTLAEAYRYAFDHTLSAAAATGARQHPGYDYRLSGKGELVLTEVSQPSAALELPEGLERALVIHVRRDQVLAELTSDAARRVAVAPGEYAVRVWKGTQGYAARVTVAAGESRKVTWSELQAVASSPVARKGAGDEAMEADALEGLTPEARAEFEKSYLAVGDHYRLFGGGRSAYLELDFDFSEGKYRKPLKEQEFYRRVGRADLAERVQGHYLLAGGLLVAAVGVLTVSGVYLASNFNQPCNLPLSDPNWGEVCVKQAGAAQSEVARNAAFGFGGGALLLVGAVFAFSSRHPVEAHEARQLADEYNQALLRKLGGTPPKPVQRPVITFDLAPVVAPHGAALALVGHF